MITHVIVELEYPVEDEYFHIDTVFPNEYYGYGTPLIRCRDCIYWKRYCRIVDGVASNHVCGRKRELDGLMHRSKADDFCSWAKRRNDETD